MHKQPRISRTKRYKCPRQLIMKLSSLINSAKFTARAESLTIYNLPYIEVKSSHCWDQMALARQPPLKHSRATVLLTRAVCASLDSTPSMTQKHSSQRSA